MKRLILFILIVVLGQNPVAYAQQDFAADSVSFSNDNSSIHFSGTLTIPKGDKKFPAVVIVSGTGKQDQDGTMAGHKQFKTIAEYLASHGIAVLRVDDRGIGNTTGTYETSTTGDFAEDALAAVNFLRGIKRINPDQIGLLGHSEGGAVISIAASKSEQVKFLVSIAGLAMSGFDAQIRQNEDIIKAAKLPEYDKQRYNEINRVMFETAFKYADSADLGNKLTAAYTTWKKKDDVFFKTLNIKFDHFRFSSYSYIQMAVGPWYRYFIKYDAPKVMAGIKVPVLALNGDKDLMVACGPNLENWKTFTGGGHNNVTTVIIPGVDHLFLPAVLSPDQKPVKNTSGFSPLALHTIEEWINNRFK